VALGQPGGGLAAPAHYPIPPGFGAVLAAGDFDGDGRPDLVVAQPSSFYPCPMGPCPGEGAPASGVAVLHNHGDGSFDAPQPFDTGSRPAQLVTADLNGDGALDFALGEDAQVEVFLNDRHGSFRLAASTPMEAPVSALAAADFDRDGNADLAIVDGCTVG